MDSITRIAVIAAISVGSTLPTVFDELWDAIENITNKRKKKELKMFKSNKLITTAKNICKALGIDMDALVCVKWIYEMEDMPANGILLITKTVDGHKLFRVVFKTGTCFEFINDTSKDTLKHISMFKRKGYNKYVISQIFDF